MSFEDICDIDRNSAYIKVAVTVNISDIEIMGYNDLYVSYKNVDLDLMFGSDGYIGVMFYRFNEYSSFIICLATGGAKIHINNGSNDHLRDIIYNYLNKYKQLNISIDQFN